MVAPALSAWASRAGQPAMRPQRRRDKYHCAMPGQCGIPSLHTPNRPRIELPRAISGWKGQCRGRSRHRLARAAFAGGASLTWSPWRGGDRQLLAEGLGVRIGIARRLVTRRLYKTPSLAPLFSAVRATSVRGPTLGRHRRRAGRRRNCTPRARLGCGR